MDIIRHTVIAALVGLGVPVALVAQLAPRGPAAFSMTIEGQQQGVFPGGGKGGVIGGLRFSYGVKSPRDAASGLPTGKRQHSPVVVTKAVGIASPQLLSAVTKNENLKSVVISVPGGEGLGYTIKLVNANVSEIKQYTEVINGRATVLEDVSFTFQKIEVQDPGTGTTAMDDWEAPAM
jgi:type VI secretion system secreted protein Hcp